MPKALHDLADKIKAKGGAKNPFAVARSILGTDAQIAARQKSKGKPMKAKKKGSSYG